MLRIKESHFFEYEIRGFYANMDECMSASEYGLEEAIATAQVEWCDEQDSATITEADTGRTAAEIDRYGRIYLAPNSGWEVEIA